MRLNSDQLVAFMAVVQHRSFTKAAKAVHITQPSLTKRIQLLEGQLGFSLFTRKRVGSTLTADGENLYRHCLQRQSLEKDFLASFCQSDELEGTVRIAGKSTLLHELVLPPMATLLRKHRKIRLEMVTTVTSKLPNLLLRDEVDFIFMDRELNTPALTKKVIGSDRYRVIESAKYPTPDDTFLDATPEDNITDWYFDEIQRKLGANIKKSYFQNNAGIIRAVALGIGRAVIEERAIPAKAGVRRIKGFPVIKQPIVLHYRKRAQMTRLHGATLEVLEAIKDS